MPVSKGGTGGTSPYEALVNLLPSYAGNEGKVLGLSGGTPAWRGLADLLPAHTTADNGKVLGLDDGQPAWISNDGSPVFVSPDYANNVQLATTGDETVVSLTAIAPSDGYVRFSGRSSNSAFPTVSGSVDGRALFASFGLTAGTFSTSAPVISEPIPVTSEQALSLTVMNNQSVSATTAYLQYASILFFPVKYSKPPTPIVVEGGDYSTSEQPVMVNDNGTLRPKLWVDKRPIYQMSFNSLLIGDLNGLAADDTKKIALNTFVPNLREITDEFLNVNIANIQDRMRLGSNSTAGNVISTAIQTALITASGTMYFKNTRANAFASSDTNIYLFGWVEYTKTTDTPSP
jgi:hypothetical protein